MNNVFLYPSRKTAVTYGILLISGILFGILNSVPALEYPDYLSKIATIKTRVLAAVFFQFAMASVYVWIAVLTYSLIKPYNIKMALGYFCLRIIGAIFLFIGIVTLLALLFISQTYIAAGQPNSSYFQTLGELIRVSRDWLNHIGMILPWSMGGLLLYYCFFRLKLIPSWLSIWGIAGSSLTLAATFLFMFDLIKVVSPIYFILNTPAALFELVLAFYLIFKGFKQNIS